VLRHHIGRRVWLCCQDPHRNLDALVTEKRLPHPKPHQSIWYGFLDLPSPFSDRHWAVDVWNNVSLANKSQGTAWEHPWSLNTGILPTVRQQVVDGTVGALTVSDFDNAVSLPTNNGGWVAIQLSSGQTLLAYHAATQLGGVFPDKLVARFTLNGMADLLNTVLERAKTIHTHYTGDHTPILSGDNTPMPRF